MQKKLSMLCLCLFTFACGDDKKEEESSTYEGTNLSFRDPNSNVGTIHFDGIDAQTLYELMIIKPTQISSKPRTLVKQGYKVNCFSIEEKEIKFTCSLNLDYKTGKVISEAKSIDWITDNSVPDLDESYYGKNLTLIQPKSSEILSFIQITGEDAKTLYQSFEVEELDLSQSEHINNQHSTFIKSGEEVLCAKFTVNSNQMTTYGCNTYLAYRTGFVYPLNVTD